MKQLTPLLVGFLLTTVVGGLLGYFFQLRSWRHQYEVQFRAQERERANRAFEEISRLLDKRLYRLRQLYWGLSGPTEGRREEDQARRMDEYRAVLYEWNDNINRNLALVQQYFGASMRDRLDYEVGAAFVQLGRQVESLWKEYPASRSMSHPQLDRRIKELNGMIYGFNIRMLRLIQSGSIGAFNPDAIKWMLESPATDRLQPFENTGLMWWGRFPGLRLRRRPRTAAGGGRPQGRP
jgi:hypothetical protein